MNLKVKVICDPAPETTSGVQFFQNIVVSSVPSPQGPSTEFHLVIPSVEDSAGFSIKPKVTKDFVEFTYVNSVFKYYAQLQTQIPGQENFTSSSFTLSFLDNEHGGVTKENCVLEVHFSTNQTNPPTPTNKEAIVTIDELNDARDPNYNRIITLPGKVQVRTKFLDIREKLLMKGSRNGNNGNQNDKFGILDYRWTSGSGPESLGGRNLDQFPVLSVQEYQPYVFSNYVGLLYDTFRWGQTSIDGVMQGAPNTLAPLNGARDALVGLMKLPANVFNPSQITSEIRRLNQQFTNPDIQDKLKDYDIFAGMKTEKDKSEKLLGVPMRELSSIVMKERICEYDLPWFTTEDTMSVEMDSQLGEYNSLGDYAGDRGAITQAAEYIDKFLAMANSYVPVSLPPMFDWRFDYASAQKPQVRNRFVLYNDTWENLKRNFRFIMSLSSGAFWMQVDDTRFSSNLYRVIVPGRFDLDCCTLQIKVSYKGSTRNVSSEKVKDLYNLIGPVEPLTSALDFRGMDFFVPDMYVVEVVFSSLLPQNFNTYLNMLINNNWKPEDGTTPLVVNKVGGVQR